VLVPEGKEPRTGLAMGFDADFFLVIHGEHASLFDNGGAGVLPFQRTGDAFFHEDGRGTTRTFLDGWAAARADDPTRPVLMGTADHDFSRLRTDPRTPEQLGAALTFLFTWGTVPSLYYGDEIGMRYLPGLPDVEGSVCNPGYNRSGCRTPMQWDDSPNAGFSTGTPWLPANPNYREINAAAQRDDPDSVFHYYRRLIALRHTEPAVAHGDFTMLLPDDDTVYAFTRRYTDDRGEVELLVLGNFSGEEVRADVDGWDGAELVLGNHPDDLDDPGRLRPWEARVHRRIR